MYWIEVNAGAQSSLEIANMLKVNINLLILDIGGNFMFSLLACWNNVYISHLKLTANERMSDSCVEIAKALEINNTLIDINLQCNNSLFCEL